MNRLRHPCTKNILFDESKTYYTGKGCHADIIDGEKSYKEFKKSQKIPKSVQKKNKTKQEKIKWPNMG